MKSVVLGTILLMGTMVYGHGEDKLGPHKGYIKMPGAFHTEVVGSGFDQFKIYLLDMDFKNPVVAKSTVDIRVNKEGNEEFVSCRETKDHFQCALPKGFSMNGGELVINATRAGAVGTEVRYVLPLALEKGAHGGDHSKHHH